jgi:hypothetical protein
MCSSLPLVAASGIIVPDIPVPEMVKNAPVHQEMSFCSITDAGFDRKARKHALLRLPVGWHF